MELRTHIPLSQYLTMRLGGPARFMADVQTIDELRHIIATAKERNLRYYVIGGGSNIIAHDEPFDGVIIRNQIKGITTIAETGERVTIKANAGELWDDLVRYAVDRSLTGIEAMSIIPGTCGAAPVQNIGAYGQEVSDTLVSLEALDTETGKIVVLTHDDCKFSYRGSIFRDSMPGRYIIISITLELYITPPQPPFYAGLQKYLDEYGVTDYTPQVIRDAVIAIRQTKLPDPRKQPNAGSFFKNALIERWQLDDLLAKHPNAPHYDMGNGTYKIPTGWLIEQCGLKGLLLHGMRVNPANALVLINESAKSYNDLANARQEIMTAVRDTFRIQIEQEPLEI